MSNEYTTTLQAFKEADDAWSAELERRFGRNAGDVRYTEQGRTGATLAPLYQAFIAAADAWEAAAARARGEAQP